jgi:hypothetical protein
MAEEGFFRRWARLKGGPEEAPAQAPVAAPSAAVAPVATPAGTPAAAPASGIAPAVAPERGAERPALTLEDVARLTPESDYSAFVAKGVDQAVRRMALKKLFADPNFAVMDRLDIYIDDYNKVSPLSDEMLASLKHAPGVLSRLFGDAEPADPQDESKDEDQADGAPRATQASRATQDSQADQASLAAVTAVDDAPPLPQQGNA